MAKTPAKKKKQVASKGRRHTRGHLQRKAHSTNPCATVNRSNKKIPQVIAKKNDETYDPDFDEEDDDDDMNKKMPAKTQRRGGRNKDDSDDDDEEEEEIVDDMDDEPLESPVVARGTKRKARGSATISSEESPGDPNVTSRAIKDRQRIQAADQHKGRNNKAEELKRQKEIAAQLRSENRNKETQLVETADELERARREKEDLEKQLRIAERKLSARTMVDSDADLVLTKEESDVLHKQFKVAVRKVFRSVKFVKDEKQEVKFGDKVINQLNFTHLNFKDGMTEEERNKRQRERDHFAQKHLKAWMKYLNEQRNYVQSELKKAVITYADKKELDMLPDPKFFDKYIVTREINVYAPKEDDSDEVKKQKKEFVKNLEDLMDFYTDYMVPTVAGKVLYHDGIRRFEPMSTSEIPNSGGQLRITAGTEALTTLMYKNGYDKWNAMREWDKDHPKTIGQTNKYPRYNPKKPGVNVNWKTPFSDSFAGQNRYGGWNKEGRIYFYKLQKRIFESRKANAARHLEEDQACVDRLYELHKDKYETEGQPKKQKVAEVVEEEDDEDEDLWDTEE